MIATSSQGEGDPSDEVTATVLRPDKVENVTVVSGRGELRVSWKESQHASGYKVQWKSGSQGFEDASTAGREHIINRGDVRAYSIPSLNYGTQYTVRVIAAYGSSEVEPSDEVTGTVADPYADDILVSNVGQGSTPLHYDIDSTSHTIIQGFTTGSRPSQVQEIILPDLLEVEPNTEIAVNIYSHGALYSHNVLYSLDGPESLSTGSDATFTVPSGTSATLEPDTTYYVWVERVSGSLRLTGTRSGREDAESDPGWSLANICRVNYPVSYHHQSPCLIGAFKVSLKGRYLPLVSVADASAVEGSDVVFTVTLNETSSEEVTVEYDTSDGTATGGIDYTSATSQTLTFAAGETTKTISIATTDETEIEDDESFTLTLSNPSSNAAIEGSGEATGTIVNNDVTALTDATLSSLTLTDSNSASIALSPSFARFVDSYTASVGNEIESLTATAVKNESGATVAFVDDDDTSTPGEAEYDLEVGTNLVQVTVTSQDGNEVKTYTVNVTRAGSDDATLSGLALTDANSAAVDLSPSPFSPDTEIYTASVANED